MGARGCILPIKWVKTYLGPDENPLGTIGKAVCAILGENFFLRKTHFLVPNWPKSHTKWAKRGPPGGSGGVNFGFLRPPDPLGPLKNQFGAKKICEKTCF